MLDGDDAAGVPLPVRGTRVAGRTPALLSGFRGGGGAVQVNFDATGF